MKRMKLMMLAMLPVLCMAQSVSYKQISDIAYSTSTDAYATERCKLDVYYPDGGATDCPVVVWFHGGGLTSGCKQVPQQLTEAGLVVVAANYRLLPKVTIDECIDDAAAAVAWTFANAERYGGSKHKIFVSGHSAGGYLTMMLGLDKQWLAKYGVDADSIAALIPFSGQAISHFAYRKMNGLGNLQPTIDQYAPLYHVRADAPPMVLITGDRELELFGRYEENAYLWRMMKLTGHKQTYLYELGGHGHVTMAVPAFHILRQWVNKTLSLPTNF